MFDMCLGVKDVIDVIKLVNNNVFINRDDYFKFKYIDGGGYIIYLNDKYIIELSDDLSTLSGYKIETSHKIGGIDSRFIDDYAKGFVFTSTYSTGILGYTLLEDLETNVLKVLEFSGINYCKVIDYFKDSLKVDGDTLQSIYFNTKDLLQHSRSYVLWYKGKLFALLNCTDSCIESLVKDMGMFITWYNSEIDKGWDYSVINSLLNLSYYNLEVITNTETKDISLSLVELLNGLIGNKKEFYRLNVGVNGMLL